MEIFTGRFFLFLSRSFNRIIHGSLATKSWLERVVIHHISNKPNRIEASNGASLAFKYSAETKTLTIRKPALSMGNNWQIKLS